VVIQETVKNWYKNVINQESGNSWLANHMVNRDLSQPRVKDTTMIAQDGEIPDDVTLLCMPTMWIHWEGHTAALLLIVIWRQTHLAVWLCTPFLSSPPFIPCTCLLSACLCRGHQVETFYHSYQHSREHGGRIKVFYSPTNAHVIVLKTTLKFTLK